MPEASATSIGAADGRLFRLRKTAMLSRHWRLWLSFPPPGPLPKTILLYRGGFLLLKVVGTCFLRGQLRFYSISDLHSKPEKFIS